MPRLLPLAVAVFLAAVAVAQDTQVLINQNPIDASEAAVYHGLQAQIDEQFRDAGDQGSVEGRFLDLLERIAAASLRDDAKYFLRDQLASRAFESAAKPTMFAQHLLRANNEHLRDAALNYLFRNTAQWRERRSTVRALIELVRSRSESEDRRAAALWVLHDGRQRCALRLAAGLVDRHELPTLAHAAATMIVSALEPSELATAFADGGRALREVAARTLVSPQYDESVRSRAVAALLATAQMTDEPPQYRGEAIEALATTVTFKLSHDALVQLLDRRWWFFGATGHHFRVHSLAPVIEGLSSTGDQADRELLAALRPELSALRPGEREYVEWLLDNALGIDRPIFSDRVIPD